jgi:anti-sigma regulatory factor (Ser/Thr protein kinase)
MTAHRAALPVITEVMSVGHEWLLTAEEPTGMRYASNLRPIRPVLDELDELAITQPSAACGLPARPESVKTARDFTGRVLRTWGLADLTDAAELVISELVTNALRHGLEPGQAFAEECPVRLQLLGQDACLMCMVTDPGSGVPVLREPGPCAETGRGLNVVECCSARWGWDPLDGGGKVVWALLHSGA